MSKLSHGAALYLSPEGAEVAARGADATTASVTSLFIVKIVTMNFTNVVKNTACSSKDRQEFYACVIMLH